MPPAPSHPPTAHHWRRICLIVMALAIGCAAGCSDDAGGAGSLIDAAGGDEAVDSSHPDDGGDSADPDAGRGSDAGDSRRQPRDTDNSWDWDVDDDTDPSGEEFSLEEVVPPTGPVEGGNRVRLVGTGFERGTRVFFGVNEMEVDVTAGEMVGDAPASPGPGAVTVKAIAPDGETHTLRDGYAYVEELELDSVSPGRVPIDGGVELDVRGEGFRAETAVSFDGAPALRVNVIDDGHMRVVAPPGAAGPADVRVTTSDDSKVLDEAVTYFAPLEIEAVRPASGTTDGGETVEIEGMGFNAQTSFEFEGRRADVQHIDPRSGVATVTTPAGSAGLADVVAESDSDSAIFKDGYLYRDDDSSTVAALSPSAGPASGGTEVELRGWGLDAPDLEVTFGGAEASIVAQGESYVVAKTPAGSPGQVDVVVSDGSGEIGSLDDAFEYYEDIWIDDVSPDEGETDGGEDVTILGSGFSRAERVSFGGLNAAFEVVSDTRIEATTPAHSVGQVDVVVARDGAEARLRRGYEYAADLQVWGFDPVRGAIAGGTYVELRGQGFSSDTEVFFGDERVEQVERVDPNNLRLYTPAHPPGEVEVSVEVGDERAEGPYGYHYFNPASRNGGASGAGIDGAVNVTVMSTNGGPVENAYVMLSTRKDTKYQGMTDENGQITLSGPEVYGTQTVTATARDYSTATVEEVDAENITVFLTYLDAEGGGGGGGPAPPYAIVRGEVDMLGKVAHSDGQSTYEMAVVSATRRDIYSGQYNPGPGNTVIGSEPYEIITRTGEVAIVALCGAYVPETDEFEPQFMGVRRHLFVDNGEEKTVDIDCDVPLDQTANVKLVNPVYSPNGPDNNRVTAWWDFGSDGLYEFPEEARGLSDMLQIPLQPDPQEVPGGMTYTFTGGSFTGDYSPSTQTYVEGVDDLSTTVVMPPLLDVPELVSPRQGAPIENQTITFQADGPYYPDMYWVRFFDAQGIQIWEFVVPGDQQRVRLPEFPDFSWLPPEQRPNPLDMGTIYATVVGIRAGSSFVFDDYSYSDLSLDAWRAYSLTQWTFQGLR